MGHVEVTQQISSLKLPESPSPEAHAYELDDDYSTSDDEDQEDSDEENNQSSDLSGDEVDVEFIAISNENNCALICVNDYNRKELYSSILQDDVMNIPQIQQLKNKARARMKQFAIQSHLTRCHDPESFELARTREQSQKLREKLKLREKMRKNIHDNSSITQTTEPQEDMRSVDDLVSYIESTTPKSTIKNLPDVHTENINTPTQPSGNILPKDDNSTISIQNTVCQAGENTKSSKDKHLNNKINLSDNSLQFSDDNDPTSNYSSEASRNNNMNNHLKQNQHILNQNTINNVLNNVTGNDYQNKNLEANDSSKNNSVMSHSLSKDNEQLCQNKSELFQMLNNLETKDYPRFWEEDDLIDPDMDEEIEIFRRRLEEGHDIKNNKLQGQRISMSKQEYEQIAKLCRDNTKNRFRKPYIQNNASNQTSQSNTTNKKK